MKEPFKVELRQPWETRILLDGQEREVYGGLQEAIEAADNRYGVHWVAVFREGESAENGRINNL